MNDYGIKRIKKYFADNPEIFNNCVVQLDDLVGCLDGERYYDMSEFDDICSGMTASEIALKIYYGFDADSYSTDFHGEISYSEFNPQRNYVSFNGYGNFISTDTKDYSEYIDDDEIIKEMNENREYIDEIYEHDELLTLFNELD